MGKKGRQSKTRLVKALVDSGASESILAKSKADKLPVKKTKKEQQWSTSAGILITNTKIATSFRFPELHANKLINQSLHLFNHNIDRYDMIIGRGLIGSLGIDIHGTDMTIYWYDAAIPWRDIYYTTNYVFDLSQYNTAFNSEKKLSASSMLNILKPILKQLQKAPLILILKKEMSYTHY